jgi:hypothetical protein
MKKTFATIIALVIAGAALHAQIPTIDASSLQQLYAQYQTMQQQLNTAKSIYSTSTSILSQEQSIYQNALGDVSRITGGLNSWMSSFGAMQSQQNINGNWFNLSSTNPLVPVASFNNNVGYWANQMGGGYGTGNLQTCWQTSIANVNNGTATSGESKLAMAGYNSHLVDNARTSRAYGSNIVSQSSNVVANLATNGGTNGTLIQQAAAQNTLIYQQTALLDQMKNDINDATIAEAADRDRKLKEEKDREDQERAMNNAAGGDQ